MIADIARFKGEIAGYKIEAVRLRSKSRENAIRELRDITFRELELSQSRRALSRTLNSLEIRAPVGGIVYGSTVFGPNAVVRPAEALMYIVPQDQPLIIRANVPAVHADVVHVGQSANLRFSVFDQRATPDIAAIVTLMSADVIQDQRTGADFYRVELAPLEEDMQGLDGKSLLPGMPVEVFLRTYDRTPLSYLTKPLSDYLGRAFRES
jgi:HlyD family secretion protein